MIKLLIPSLVALALTGCKSTPPPDYAYIDTGRCMNYGFQVGTPQMAQCRQNEAMSRQLREAVYCSGSDGEGYLPRC